jgi:hypothetical protein
VAIYDKSVVKQLAAVQQKNIANAQMVTLEDWNKRSLVKEFLDSVARLTASLQ